MDYLIIALCAAAVILSTITLILILQAQKRAREDRSNEYLQQMIADSLQSELRMVRMELNAELRANRKENSDALALGLQNSVAMQNAALLKLSQEMNDSLGTLRRSVAEMSGGLDSRMEAIRTTVEHRLAAMQIDNQRKLDEIRGTVDERLQKTLDEKVGQSFRLVNERLEQVYKGLGEMQTLATGVGDLKKVLSNVKTRGIMGELQLERILAQSLTPAQYAKNVITKKGTRDPVEFAVKLPGKTDSDSPVYLPIDSKFPTEPYMALLDAYDTADRQLMDIAGKNLENTIKKFAKDISEKYIDPPNTTDFAVLFLPFEGLYAEVVRRGDLLESLQREYHINVAGPSTLSALLNSLQLGFRTLAIEKRSTEVWNLLAAVKTEFSTFSKVLSTAQDRLNRASADLDTLVGVRTRKILGKLKTVDELPAEQATLLLDSAEIQDPDE